MDSFPERLNSKEKTVEEYLEKSFPLLYSPSFLFLIHIKCLFLGGEEQVRVRPKIQVTKDDSSIISILFS